MSNYIGYVVAIVFGLVAMFFAGVAWQQAQEDGPVTPDNSAYVACIEAGRVWTHGSMGPYCK